MERRMRKEGNKLLCILCVLPALGLLALDQWVKAWVSAVLPLGAVRPLLPGLVELQTVHNYGAAWSSFSGQRWFLILLTSVICLAVAALLVKRVIRHPLGVLAGCLILSGGLGNILDRARLGYVVDMFHFQFWPSYPVFNVADMCIVCGAILGAAYYLWIYEKQDGGSHGASDTPSA